MGDFIQTSAGDDLSCAIQNDGFAQCWGESEFGTPEPPHARFQTLSVGWNSACGLTTENAILCWGSNQSGQLDVPEIQN
jgi:alpha-tubulin suppressor-like RCC1 family protein